MANNLHSHFQKSWRIGYLVIGAMVGFLLGFGAAVILDKLSDWQGVILGVIGLCNKILEKSGTAALFEILTLLFLAFFFSYHLHRITKHYGAEIKRIAEERNRLQEFVLGEYARLSTNRSKG